MKDGEVSDLFDTGMTQEAAARVLGISQAAVSQRVRAAAWVEDLPRPQLTTSSPPTRARVAGGQYAFDAIVTVACSAGLSHPVVSGVFARVARSARGPRTGASSRRRPLRRSRRRPHCSPGTLDRLPRTGQRRHGTADRWPEGIASPSPSGPGRYQELQKRHPGTAERFIIGTFLAALACAGAARRWA